jgi:nicotinamidase-related amidase
MFSSPSPKPGLNVPQFATKRALIVVNAQNDSLHCENGVYVTKAQDWADRIKDVVPHFRKLGDVIWVRTEFVDVPAVASKDLSQIEREIAKMDEKNREDRKLEEEQSEDDITANPPDDPRAGLPLYHPTSRAKAMMTRASAEDRAEQRTANLDAFNDRDNNLAEQMTKPRKGKQPRFMMPGTWGARIADRLLPVIDMTKDSMLIKHHYSAFENTSLLMSLRMKLVTDVYLCGCLTNVSIYATAADAVQHGLGVTVIEDCLGYRSEEKHEDAMRQMADIMGVDGIDGDEIIEEAGGRVPPDTQFPMFTGPGAGGIDMQSLSLGMDNGSEWTLNGVSLSIFLQKLS